MKKGECGNELLKIIVCIMVGMVLLSLLQTL